MTSIPISERQPFVSKHIPLKVSGPNTIPLQCFSYKLLKFLDIDTIVEQDPDLSDYSTEDDSVSLIERNCFRQRYYIPDDLASMWKYFGSVEEILAYIAPFALKSEQEAYDYKCKEEIILEKELLLASKAYEVSPRIFQSFEEILERRLFHNNTYQISSRASDYYIYLKKYLEERKQ